MKRVMSLVLVVCLLMPGKAQPITVFDPTNFTQALARYVVMGKQLAQAAQQYQTLVQQYQQQVENLRSLDPRSILLGQLVGRDMRRGLSFLAQAQYLDPDDGMWRKHMESLLREHFDFLDTNEAEFILAQAFPGRGADVYRDYFKRRDREMTATLDTYHFQGTQRIAQLRRQQQLEKLKYQFSSLGERSAVRQAQATNGMLALIAQQNEAMLDALQITMTQQARQQVAQRAAVERNIERNARYAQRVAQTPPYQCSTTPCFPAW